MNDYSKWEQLEESSDEHEDLLPGPALEKDQEKFRQEQERVDEWLQRQMAALKKKGGEAQRTTKGPPELSELKEERTWRQVTTEERKVLAMLIALSHFEEGETNLDRHPLMLELFRHNRWLEEDPGTLELLCRVHTLKAASGPGGDVNPEKHAGSAAEFRLRQMCFCGINTLAGPKKAGCSGGLLELVTTICTPTTDRAKELRKKWERKEFAKDALFDSLYPELKQFGESDDGGTGLEMYLMGGCCLLFAIFVFVLVLYLPSMAAAANKTVTLTTTVAHALASATGAGPGAGTLDPAGHQAEL